MPERLPPDEIVKQVRAFVEERKRWPRFVTVLQELQDIRDAGAAHVCAWQEVYSAFNGEDNELIALAGQFFVVTAVAHLECATLKAAKLLEEGKEAVSLRYLFNLAANQAHVDFPKLRDVLKAAVSSGESRLAAISSERSSIKEYRDRHLAHTDRRSIASYLDAVHVVEADRLRVVFDVSNSVLLGFWEVLPEYHVPPAEATYEDLLGPRGLNDLFYFARHAVRDPSIQDPSTYAKKVRSIQGALRKARADVQRVRKQKVAKP